ncbi:NAD-dependent epimerase/dehydratase family protein [Candidatus Micrarchaeota archaeon]|nr:NAD-dependent epimerase/dehydratase family protein [Candidatus Micrarchaeota archaeon]
MGANRIYITGANGRLGRAVLALMPHAMPLVRNKSGLKNEIAVDFADATALAKTLADASAVIHIAGSVRTYNKAELWKSNYELTKRIADAAPKNARIVFAGSISVYGKRLAKKPADENATVQPDSDYARSKYEAERAVSSRANFVILRIGTIYGPFEDYRMILERIKKGKMPVIGDGSNAIPFVHVDDVAALFPATLKAKPGVYNVVGEPITQKEVYAAAAKALGVEPPEKRVSYFLANASAWLGEKKAMLTGAKPKITCEHVAVLYFDRPFDCGKAKKELGFSPRKTAEGITQVAKELSG